LKISRKDLRKKIFEGDRKDLFHPEILCVKAEYSASLEQAL